MFSQHRPPTIPSHASTQPSFVRHSILARSCWRASDHHPRLLSMRAGSDLLPRDKLLKQALYLGLEKKTAAKLLDGADACLRNWSTYKTGFLTPPEVGIMKKILDPLLDIEVRAWGGHEAAERQRLFFCREGMSGEVDLLSQVEVLEIGGQFLFDMADHRDFLGSILGTGIKRSAIGDIVVQGERGAQVLVDPEMSEYLVQSLTSVRSVKVNIRPIPLEELALRPPQRKQVSSVEASLRLDSVASAGMGMSRSKMSEAIKSGSVLVNWKEATSGVTEVKEGDIVTVRGKGRMEVLEIIVTKKGRFKVDMARTT